MLIDKKINNVSFTVTSINSLFVRNT